MACILHDLRPQASDDEEQSGPNVSQVTGPEEGVDRFSIEFRQIFDRFSIDVR